MSDDITRAGPPGGVALDSINPSQEGLLHLLGNRGMSLPGFAIDAAATQDVETANEYQYTINGVGLTKAAQTGIDISAATFVNQEGDTVDIQSIPDDYQGYLMAIIDAAGTIKFIQGEIVAITATVKRPRCPAAHCPIGDVLIYNESAAAFVPGTTGLDTAGVTDTYADLMVVPATTSP